MNEYRVERINHTHRNRFADLFNQCNFSRDETSREKPVISHMGKAGFHSEPVAFYSPEKSGRIHPGRIYPVIFNVFVNKCRNDYDFNDLFVLPDYRNNGIALKLIEAAVKFAINNKSTLIQLKPFKDNLIAQKLFESVGFKSQTSASELNVYSIQF